MSTRPEDHVPLNHRDYLILLTLADGERHGYGMMKAVSDYTDGDVELDPANLYRSLKRMERDGLVEQTAERTAPDAREERRRYYAITRLGRRVLRAEAHRLERLAALARARNVLTGRSES